MRIAPRRMSQEALAEIIAIDSDLGSRDYDYLRDEVLRIFRKYKVTHDEWYRVDRHEDLHTFPHFWKMRRVRNNDYELMAEVFKENAR